MVEKEDKTTKRNGFVTTILNHYELIGAFTLFFLAILTGFNDKVDFVIFILAYLLVARQVLISAVKSVFKGHMLDENFLMAIASIVAFAIGEYAEGVAVMLFYNVGQLTEDYALDRSKSSISALMDLKPEFANLKTLSGIQKVDPSVVRLGDVIIVKAGEKIPLDGIVIKGTSSVDSAMLTGESEPVHAAVSDEVYSGTLNLDGTLEVKVTSIYAESTVAKIMNMVQKAGENKAKTEKFITRFAKIYTPIVVLGAALIAVVPPIIGLGGFDTWLYRGAIFLVVSCPCALVISVPLGYFGGIGGAARHGILVKGGHFLERLRVTKTVVFDKTGTLTKGNFKLDHMAQLGQLNEETILRYSAHIEMMSNHPIAKAVVRAYHGELQHNAVSAVKEIPGKGIEGRFEDVSIAIGNEALVLEKGLVVPTITHEGTMLYLIVDSRLEAVLYINDEIKEQSASGIQALRSMGVERFVMLTGDRRVIAERVGQNLGIDEIHAELLPGDKLSILEGLLSDSDQVVFVGDGINDAPVLTRADVGISMGSLGSDIAIESSDVVLMSDEVTGIAIGMQVAKKTHSIIWQNIILALGIKIIIMILGTLGIANLWTAVFGDVGVAFLAILNAGRAIYSKA